MEILITSLQEAISVCGPVPDPQIMCMLAVFLVTSCIRICILDLVSRSSRNVHTASGDRETSIGAFQIGA